MVINYLLKITRMQFSKVYKRISKVHETYLREYLFKIIGGLSVELEHRSFYSNTKAFPYVNQIDYPYYHIYHTCEGRKSAPTNLAYPCKP